MTISLEEGCERKSSTSASTSAGTDSLVGGMREEVLARLQRHELADAALQTELREAHEFGEERHRHDRDTARQEAEETARQVAGATAAAARLRTMPWVPASADTTLISEPKTFSGKDAE